MPIIKESIKLVSGGGVFKLTPHNSKYVLATYKQSSEFLGPTDFPHNNEWFIDRSELKEFLKLTET